MLRYDSGVPPCLAMRAGQVVQSASDDEPDQPEPHPAPRQELTEAGARHRAGPEGQHLLGLVDHIMTANGGRAVGRLQDGG